jgi:hypothetical protein
MGSSRFDKKRISWSTGARFTKEDDMALSAHIHQLEKRHRELEDRLAEVQTHPSANDMEIAEIKRQKLVLKDRIRVLSKHDSLH